MMDKLLGVAKYPDRASVSALLTRKFLDKFMDYFYFSGRNREYIIQLAKHLKGKHYADQYTLIIDQIDKLQEGEHIFDAIITPRDETGFSVFWAVKYLKHILDTMHDDAQVVFDPPPQTPPPETETPPDETQTPPPETETPPDD